MADKKKADRVDQLRAMTAEERADALEAARRGMYQIRRERLSKPQTDVKASGRHRVEIARILTINRQEELKAGK